MGSKEENLRFRVYKFYSENIAKGKPFTVSHFVHEGIPKSTVYDILRRQGDGLPAKRISGTGRKAKIFTIKKLDSLQKMVNNSDSATIRTAARKFGASPTWTHVVMKTKLGINYRRKQTIPDRSEEQKAVAKTKSGRLYRKFSKRAFVLDDESYFTLSHSSINGNGAYYTSDPSSAPAEVKFSKKKKFEAKVLVWVAIGPAGLSRAFIKRSGYAINAQRYLQHCIRRRLIPYIRENYDADEYIFWPDQASSHYAKSVLDYLRAEGIHIVDKKDNPANVPELRIIERFWAYLKGLVYAKGWKAKNPEQLMSRIRYCLKKVEQTFVHDLATSTCGLIDGMRRRGVIENQ